MTCLRCDAPWPVADYEAGCPRCAAEGHASNLRLTYVPGAPGVVLPYPVALSLGEDGTPLVELPELAKALRLGRLSAKLEWCNPTGSHKDRMSAQLIARALERGADRIVAASSGNGGLSIAAYAARAGLAAEIATTDALPQAYRRAIAAYGATLASFGDSVARWHHLARRVGEGAFAATNYKVPAIGTNPFGIEGYKTIAAELSVAGKPDFVIVPCSRGDLLSGIRLGFEEVGGGMPVLVAAEPFPRLAQVLAGADYRGSFGGETAQTSTAGNTVTWQAVQALRASGGRAIPVGDAVVRAAQGLLATHGLHAELSAASALAAVTTLAQEGSLAGRHAVIVLTGSGLRDPGDIGLASERSNDAATKAAHIAGNDRRFTTENRSIGPTEGKRMTTLDSRLAALSAFAATAFTFSVAAQAQGLPALPEAIKSAGVLKAGVRCDQPPYGYKDETGKFAGVETDMAIQIAAWAFGSPDKIELTCVTAENRIPQLAGKKVDILVATLGITPERARVIDFSKPYRWGGSDMLVPKDSPIKKLDDVAGKTVIMLKGSTQAKWFEDNMPKLEGLRLNTASDALQALKQGRGDAYTHDAATLVVIAAKDPSLRLVGESFAVSDAAVGVRKNEPEWLAYVDAALDRMKAEGLYAKWVDKWIPAEIRPFYVEAFTKPKPTAR